MKVVIGYPPLDSKKGIAQISQNRQFQYTAGGLTAYSIYPVVLAYAATKLKQAGHHVFWLDGIASRWTYKQWLEELKKVKPDLLMMETKTPVVKKHWQIINKLKSPTSGISAKCANYKLQIVLVGDHVTALPKESFENSKVDYILTGGDYDFLFLNLVNHLTCGEKLEPGVLSRQQQKSKFKLNHDLNKLPIINRELTQWKIYAFKNSNFYRAPGAYTMFGRDCWWGRCTFCSWTTLYPGKTYRVIDVKKALDEVGHLIKNYQVKEIMDDSGTFPTGDWLREFCQGMIARGYNKKIRLNCNMRFNSNLIEKDYQLMGKAGFRFLLYGLESSNQKTLDKLNKNLKIELVEKVLFWAKKAGLWPHLTIMIGYPWETEKDIKKTIDFVVGLFKQGLVDSLQATIIMPYPGTPLFTYCQKRGLLKTQDWNRYDMTGSIIRTKVSQKKLLAMIRSFYNQTIWTPRFMIKTLSQLNSIDGFKYVGFQALKYFAKIKQFK